MLRKGLNVLVLVPLMTLSFTMPLKAAIIPHLNSITPESKLTGAVNTVVKVQSPDGLQLVGTNTDFIGMSVYAVLSHPFFGLTLMLIIRL